MRVDSELRKNHPAQMAWAAIAKEYRQAELRREIVAWFERQRANRD